MTPIPKSKPWRSEKYKAFIRSKPCLVCGDKADAHHEPLFCSGMGSKEQDSCCVPLCAKCHFERHALGVVTFWTRHTIAPEMEIIRLLTEYLMKGNK